MNNNNNNNKNKVVMQKGVTQIKGRMKAKLPVSYVIGREAGVNTAACVLHVFMCSACGRKCYATSPRGLMRDFPSC